MALLLLDVDQGDALLSQLTRSGMPQAVGSTRFAMPAFLARRGSISRTWAVLTGLPFSVQKMGRWPFSPSVLRHSSQPVSTSAALRLRLAVGFQDGQDALIFSSALVRIEVAGQESASPFSIAGIIGDDCLAGFPVETIGGFDPCQRCDSKNTCYCEILRIPQQPRSFEPHCRTLAGKCKLVSDFNFCQSGRPDSNRRRPAWEASILPLNYAGRPPVSKLPVSEKKSKKTGRSPPTR